LHELYLYNKTEKKNDEKLKGATIMRYIVTVTRIAPQTMDIEVEASSMEEAEQKALEKAPNLDFTGFDKDSSYEVECVAVGPGKLI